MKLFKFIKLSVFLVQIGNSIAQESKTQQLHFYDGKNRKSINSLDMEFHEDTLLYFRPESVQISYISDSVNNDSYVVKESDKVSVIAERYFIGISIVWKSLGKKDSIKYEMISYTKDYKNGGYKIIVSPYKLYFDKNKTSFGCMFPSNLSHIFERYMYDPQKSNIITKYEGEKWFFLFGKLKKSYKFRYYYYDKIDSNRLMWYHDLYIDKKTLLPLVFDEAPVYTMYNEFDYDYTKNRRIQYRCDKKRK